MMKNLGRKFILVLLIGMLLGILTPEPAYAVWQQKLIDEQDSNRFSNNGFKWLRNTGYGGKAFFYQQKSSASVTFSWGTWNSYYHSSPVRHYWSVYIPSAVFGSKAPVKYTILHGPNVIKNQNGYNNAWVYLGVTNSPVYESYIQMTNECLLYYICDHLEIEWDHAKYQWWIN